LNFQALFGFGFFAFFLALLTTPLTIALAKKYGLVDDPKTHKHPAILHRKPIPRVGGLALWLAILPAILLATPKNLEIWGIILAGSLAVAIGTLDDKFDLSPYLRLASNFLVALIVVAAGVGINFITNPFGGVIAFDPMFAKILAIFWIVWVMNMLNWSSGVDGQMPGIVVIAALTLTTVSLKFPLADPNQTATALIATITAGAALGFLVYNWHPAKIFPGYGATVLGLLIAVLAILTSGKIAAALLVLAVPLTDGALTIARRIWQKKLPVWGDRAHFHHLLLNFGLTQRQIALFYWSLCAILGAISLYLKSLGKLFALVVIVIIIGGIILWLQLFFKKAKGNL